MKSVHSRGTTTKFKENNQSFGTTADPVTNYTKDDCLTPGKVAKKFEIPTERARKLMEKLRKQGIMFANNGHRTPIIVTTGSSSTLRLHPNAIYIFKEYLNKREK